MPQTLAEFVDAARRARPDLRIDTYKVRTFGGSKTMADRIVPRIVSGEKTGTIALAAEFDDDPGRAPRVGDIYVVTDWEGAPAVMYQVTDAQTLPYEAIGEEHVQVEGPNLRNLKAWQDVHWPYFGSIMRQRGKEPSLQMPVIFQRYAIIHPQLP